MNKTNDKNTGDQSVRTETELNDFQYSFSILRSVAIDDLKRNLADILKQSYMSDHDVGRIRGLLSAYYCCQLITQEEYSAFSSVVDAYHFTEFMHSSHVVSYLSARCGGLSHDKT